MFPPQVLRNFLLHRAPERIFETGFVLQIHVNVFGVVAIKVPPATDLYSLCMCLLPGVDAALSFTLHNQEFPMRREGKNV